MTCKESRQSSAQANAQALSVKGSPQKADRSALFQRADGTLILYVKTCQVLSPFHTRISIYEKGET